MPRYTYECGSCMDTFTIRHSMKEKLEICERCSGSLIRVPSDFSHGEQRAAGSTPEQRVEKHIEDHREQLDDFKSESSKKEYNDDY